MRFRSQREIRRAFWRNHFPDADGKPRRFSGKSQNELPADVRMAFCDYVDALERAGAISDALAQRVTLD